MFNRPSEMRKLESKCMSCFREFQNEHDGYAVVVVERDQYTLAVVQFVLCSSRTFTQSSIKNCSLFLRRGGRTTRIN